MNRILLSFVIVALLTSGCGLKLFTTRVYVECTEESPKPGKKSKTDGKVIKQLELPSKSLTQPPGRATSTKRSDPVRNALGLFVQTRYAIPVDHSIDPSCPTSGKDVNPISQSSGPWCWAASAETVMKFHDEGHEFNTSQCNIVDTVYVDGEPTADDSAAFCCNNPDDAQCQKNGLPSMAFAAYGFDWRVVAGALEREKVAGQICYNGPFIFLLRYAGGGGHTFVVRDYDYDEDTDEMTLSVYDHSGIGDERIPTSFVDWSYKNFQKGLWLGTKHEHYADYVLISR